MQPREKLSEQEASPLPREQQLQLLVVLLWLISMHRLATALLLLTLPIIVQNLVLLEVV